MVFGERLQKIGSDIGTVARNPMSLGDVILDRIIESGIIRGEAGERLKKIDQRGAIDITPSNRTMAGILTKIKAGSGPIGRPFNINFEDSPDTMAYLQNQINRGVREGDTIVYSHDNGTATKPKNFEDQQAMALLGQFIAEVQPDGTVITNDTWDINGDLKTLWNRWHDKSIDPADRTFYRNALFGKVLQNAGILNTKPFGEEFKIGYNPNSQKAREIVQQNQYALEPPNQNSTKAFFIDDKIQEAKEALLGRAAFAATVPQKPKTYTVQSGDNLSSIAARNNIEIQELQRKNKISNPDLINVGQELYL